MLGPTRIVLGAGPAADYSIIFQLFFDGGESVFEREGSCLGFRGGGHVPSTNGSRQCSLGWHVGWGVWVLKAQCVCSKVLSLPRKLIALRDSLELI